MSLASGTGAGRVGVGVSTTPFVPLSPAAPLALVVLMRLRRGRGHVRLARCGHGARPTCNRVPLAPFRPLAPGSLKGPATSARDAVGSGGGHCATLRGWRAFGLSLIGRPSTALAATVVATSQTAVPEVPLGPCHRHSAGVGRPRTELGRGATPAAATSCCARGGCSPATATIAVAIWV